MEKRLIRGKKNNNGQDFPMEIKTYDWEIITNNDVLEIIDRIFDNEDRIYPRPSYKGSGMFFDEIVKCYGLYLMKNGEEDNIRVNKMRKGYTKGYDKKGHVDFMKSLIKNEPTACVDESVPCIVWNEKHKEDAQ